MLKPKHGDSAWFRHPLAFLVEAADDICYRIIDLEDGFLLGKVELIKAQEMLEAIAGSDVNNKFIQSDENLPQEKIEYLRAIAINHLIHQTVKCFIDNEEKILKGEFDEPLISKIKESDDLGKLSLFNRNNIYKSKEVVSIEMSGFEIIEKLLDIFVMAVCDLAKNGDEASAKSKKVGEFIGSFSDEEKDGRRNEYQSLLKVTDFISGMTDSFALLIFKKLTGMSLSR